MEKIKKQTFKYFECPSEIIENGKTMVNESEILMHKSIKGC